MTQDLRTALDRLECAGALLRVTAPLSVEFELAAVLWKLATGPTVLFENVAGHRLPVVGNLLNTRDKLGIALGVPADQVQAHVVGALRNPVAPTLVDEPPCQEVVHPGDLDLLAGYPVPAISEHDAGRYISAGVLTCRDPETGRRNFAICRLQVQAPGTLGVYMAPTHSRGVLEAHRRLGTTMEVAIAIGLHPGFVAASQFLTPLDESYLAGGLFGEPARLARCTSVDLEVPADAEIVLEGVVDPEERAPEGPFGEFPGVYAPQRPNPVIRLRAVTQRASPVFHMIVGGRHPEHLVTGAIAREAGLYDAVQAVVPGVRQVVLTEGGSCRFHAVVSITKRFAGEGKLAITAAFAKQDLVKHVTVVDDDIDAANPHEVEWAVATRSRAHEDVVVVPGMKSNPADPMSIDNTITKLGIDATLPVGSDRERRVTVGVPPATMREIEDRWPELIGGRRT